MTSPIILHDFVESLVTHHALQEVDQLSLDRYNNPFEQKWFLQDKEQLSALPDLSYVFSQMRSPVTSLWVQRLLDLSIGYCDYRHYGGLFVYDRGDYLEPHVDAGVHPINQGRKVATLLVYLTQATLSFWHGDTCTVDDPEVWLQTTTQIKAGQAVLFANTDTAWHSVPPVQSRRVVLTVSYMAMPDFVSKQYQNPRTRAYFARLHGTRDSEQLAEIRKARASETQHSEVYRLES